MLQEWRGLVGHIKVLNPRFPSTKPIAMHEPVTPRTADVMSRVRLDGKVAIVTGGVCMVDGGYLT